MTGKSGSTRLLCVGCHISCMGQLIQYKIAVYAIFDSKM